MLYPAVDDLLKKVESRYTLIMVTSKRARQIIEGSKPLVNTESIKPVSIAIEEIDQDKLEFTTPKLEEDE